MVIVFFYFCSPFTEIVKYFHADDEIKSKMYGTLVNETIPFYADRFERIVSENGGYFVNGKVREIPNTTVNRFENDPSVVLQVAVITVGFGLEFCPKSSEA